MAETLDALLAELHTATALPAQAALYHLSGLDPETAGRVRQAWPDYPTELRRRLVARLVELAEADFEVDFGAVFRLGLEDEDGAVRTAAIEGLWEDRDVHLISSLVSLLLEDQVTAVRAAAATSLGRFVLLGEVAETRLDPHVAAYQALLTACRNLEEDSQVRRRALESLAYVGNQAVADLIRAAYSDPEEDVRISAVFAMGRSADDCWARYVLRELASPSPGLRYEAAIACGELELDDAVPDLLELADDSDPQVQWASLWALGQIGGEAAREALERYCESEDKATRTAAEEALNELLFLHGDLTDIFTFEI